MSARGTLLVDAAAAMAVAKMAEVACAILEDAWPGQCEGVRSGAARCG